MRAYMRFTCNICGCENEMSANSVDDRERPTCTSCHSSIRFRSVALALSRALFHSELTLPEFPRLKTIRGLGISDSEVYSRHLENRFNYTNTFYHQGPSFDLLRPDEREFQRYDFVTCSDVLEHVCGRVERAFETLARLLKPSGFLILTLPFTHTGESLEHYPCDGEAGVTRIGNSLVVVSRSADGAYRVFDDPVFHGGDGWTLEMRVFSQADIAAKLRDAGFCSVRFEAAESPRFGVMFSSPCSLPIIAAKQPFFLPTEAVREMMGDYAAANALLAAARQSRWLRFGAWLGLGPNLRRA